MEPRGNKEAVFSKAFEDVCILQGFIMVPSASSMIHYVDSHVNNKYDGTIADDDKWIVEWSSLSNVSPEEFERFVSKYTQKGGKFKFDTNEVRKIDWPDEEGWHEWMQETMNALWVRSRSPIRS